MRLNMNKKKKNKNNEKIKEFSWDKILLNLIK